MRRLGVIVIAALAGCGSKSSEPPKPEPTAGSAAAKPAPANGSAAAKPAKPDQKLTKEQLAELRTRMKAGWALQKANKWAEAVPQFEAALVAAPSDQRALTELGWSALQAGDFPKAKKATEQAIRVAVDKKVKAAALYNLGLTQEKSGDKDGALKSFIASLALRPNAIVEKAVGKLGATPDKEIAFCATGKDLCDCVLHDAFDEIQLDQAKCEPIAPQGAPAGFKAAHVTSDAFYGSEYTYWVDASNQFIGVVAGKNDRGRYMESTERVKAETRTIGDHEVLWLETKTTADSMYASMDDDTVKSTSDETIHVTLCVLGDGKTATRCPLRMVPIKQTGVISTDDTPGPKTETVVDLAIADDGTATVKLVKGVSDEQIAKLVGPHKLW